jgi:hypothetical protein
MHDDTTHERIEIPQGKFVYWMILAFALGFIFFGIYLYQETPMLGGVLILFACFIGVKIFRLIMDPRPRLVLDHEGVEDRNNGMGLIAWGDITRTSIDISNGQEFINLFVRNEDEYLSRVSKMKRATLKLNKSLGFSPITIAMSGIKMPASELLALINSRRE